MTFLEVHADLFQGDFKHGLSLLSFIFLSVQTITMYFNLNMSQSFRNLV